MYKRIAAHRQRGYYPVHQDSSPKRGDSHGWSTRSVSLIFAPGLILGALPAFANQAESSPSPSSNELLVRIAIALGAILIAQAIIPVGKAYLQKRILRKTYRAYLRAHVDNALESFGGAGSTHFAEKNDLAPYKESDWFTYLQKHDLGVPQIFSGVVSVIEKARAEPEYIPSVSYFGIEGKQLGWSSPVWELNGPESGAAVQYFLTYDQIEQSLDYQYSGWYFELMKGDPASRARWCQGLENVLYDMAQHYKAVRDLKQVLDRLG